MHVGDVKGQINMALHNLEAVLKQAGMSLSNVVRLNYYTPNVDLLLEHYGVLVGRLVSPEEKLRRIIALERDRRRTGIWLRTERCV